MSDAALPQEKYVTSRHSLTTHIIPEVKINDTSEYDNGSFSDKFPFSLRFGMKEFHLPNSRYLLDVTDINLTLEAAQQLLFDLGNAIVSFEVSKAGQIDSVPENWPLPEDSPEDE